MSDQREIIEIPAKIIESQGRTEKLRVAAYCRVSTSQEAQQNSYQAQRAYYLDKIESNPDWVLADIFADKAISGISVDNRTEFQRVIRWCKRGKIDLILTKSISRFARNTKDYFNTVSDSCRTAKALDDAIVDLIVEYAENQTWGGNTEPFRNLIAARRKFPQNFSFDH